MAAVGASSASMAIELIPRARGGGGGGGGSGGGAAEGEVGRWSVVSVVA